MNIKKDNITFSFGENWLDYLETISPERIEEAKNNFIKLIGLENLAGLSFLDIGCGSGLFSLCALEFKAKKVLSIDVDIKSVEAAKKLKSMIDSENWEIKHGSILDNDFINSLEKSDIVYSWGVLHHTGNMWTAIENASNLVKDNGFFIIAIYNKTKSSEFWLKFKKFYNNTNPLMKKIMVISLFLPRLVVRILKLKHPWKDERGMNIYHDAVDWAGGLPYEYASYDEILEFVQPLGFQIINSIKTNSIGCNQFVFKKIK